MSVVQWNAVAVTVGAVGLMALGLVLFGELGFVAAVGVVVFVGVPTTIALRRHRDRIEDLEDRMTELEGAIEAEESNRTSE